MTNIRELDAKTVERIAAGEVVERPASVVKELVENSLDADAGRVQVAVTAGGTDGIRVTDDGIGMTEAELRRAVEKHTTSKIADIADLEGGVGTLGFRGEALHAIGAVSRLTVTSRPRDGGSGTELTVEGGEVTDVSPAGCPTGTTVEVEDLFYNVPARRKYLKQESTEFAHVNTVVTNYALANPDVAVSLSHDGRETFATTGQGDRQATVMSVYGREVARSMLPVDTDATPDGPLDGVSGLVSHPETNRASRDYLSTFVNGRYVTASTVREAVVEAYGSQLASDRYPFAVVDLAVDPGTVDVNVHPRKLDVRFADDEAVRDQIRTTIEETLLAEGLIRSSAPRGRSAADEATIRPGDDGSGDGGGGADAPSDTADADTARSDTDTRRSSQSSSSSSSSSRSSTGASAGRSSGTSDARGSGSTGAAASVDDGRRNRRQRAAGDGRKFDGAHDQARLGDADGDPDERTFDSLPPMRVLGQFRDTYIVAETGDGLVLVDQHAADERINYERLRGEFEGETTTQALADPVRLELTAREAELFESHGDALARLGFQAQRVDDRTVEVRSVPSLVAETAGPDIVRDVLGEFVGGDAAAAETVDAAVDELLADMACYPSITGNTSLTEGSVVDLLDRLDDCENPYACPHGRPVVVELDDEELENRFERDYPGHGG
ncbi:MULTISPECIES: DNA mismatch repair endonuclease MutL [Salinibaculum]|uniref:DNA mismatch repair endonuclease MutL n=1 Tax=Salinibaculum TaxID=2732368 RepID=UPI0030D51611